jgi:hypothetical protein
MLTALNGVYASKPGVAAAAMHTLRLTDAEKMKASLEAAFLAAFKTVPS